MSRWIPVFRLLLKRKLLKKISDNENKILFSKVFMYIKLLYETKYNLDDEDIKSIIFDLCKNKTKLNILFEILDEKWNKRFDERIGKNLPLSLF